MMYKPARYDDLKDIAAQAVLDSLADIGLVLLVGQRAGGFAHRVEVIDAYICLLDAFFGFLQMVGFAVGQQLNDFHRVVEMVEDHHRFVQDVLQVGGVIALQGYVLDGDMLKIAYSVE